MIRFVEVEAGKLLANQVKIANGETTVTVISPGGAGGWIAVEVHSEKCYWVSELALPGPGLQDFGKSDVEWRAFVF
jgi:hypothetical protein